MSEFKGTKPIIGYEEYYLIHEDGYVISLRNWNGVKNRIMKMTPNSFGYLRVSLTDGTGKTKTKFVHKLVATHFKGEKKKNELIRHLDGNKLNNNVNNLKYGTAKQNAEDRLFHGNTAFGSRIGTHKLSESTVSAIRNEYKKRGDMSLLAVKYNTSIANVSYIINYKSRKNG